MSPVADEHRGGGEEDPVEHAGGEEVRDGAAAALDEDRAGHPLADERDHRRRVDGLAVRGVRQACDLDVIADPGGHLGVGADVLSLDPGTLPDVLELAGLGEAAREGAGAHRLARTQIGLDQPAKHFAAAFVHLGQGGAGLGQALGLATGQYEDLVGGSPSVNGGGRRTTD